MKRTEGTYDFSRFIGADSYPWTPTDNGRDMESMVGRRNLLAAILAEGWDATRPALIEIADGNPINIFRGNCRIINLLLAPPEQVERARQILSSVPCIILEGCTKEERSKLRDETALERRYTRPEAVRAIYRHFPSRFSEKDLTRECLAWLESCGQVYVPSAKAEKSLDVRDKEILSKYRHYSQALAYASEFPVLRDWIVSRVTADAFPSYSQVKVVHAALIAGKVDTTDRKAVHAAAVSALDDSGIPPIMPLNGAKVIECYGIESPILAHILSALTPPAAGSKEDRDAKILRHSMHRDAVVALDAAYCTLAAAVKAAGIALPFADAKSDGKADGKSDGKAEPKAEPKRRK